VYWLFEWGDSFSQGWRNSPSTRFPQFLRIL